MRALPLLLLLPSCISPPLTSVSPTVSGEAPIRISQNPKDKVDILFMVDNSKSMDPMSAQLRQRFDQFLKVFRELAADGTYTDLHIGVVTSDYGAGGGGGGCDASPGGERGVLQNRGAAAPATCVPPVGDRFIRYDFHPGGANNLPASNAAQDLAATFTCMASVGAGGCGYEHVLESVYAALHNNLAENAGFVRDDALLAVVFVTNEDDASAPPDTDLYSDAATQYGYIGSYRQTRFGVVCGDPAALPPYGDSSGPLADCRPAPNPPGKQYDVQRYIDFFTRPASEGGVKADPGDVILFGIDAPSDPLRVILATNPYAGKDEYVACSALDEDPAHRCVPVVAHSCRNAQQPELFGDPAVRLNAVIGAAAHHQISSICAGDYESALAELAGLIVSDIGAGCFPVRLSDVAHPDCDVVDETRDDAGRLSLREIVQCSNPMTTLPCWTLDTKPGCATLSPQSVGVTVHRDGPAPPHTYARVTCATGA